MLQDTDVQPVSTEFTPEEVERWGRKMEAGYSLGQEARVVLRTPTLSILHIWNKPGYPTPLHSHDADCLYFLVGGSVRVGTEDLLPGDSFFIPAEMPYTYKVGPEGAEVLEIRQAGNWDLKLLAKNPAYFDKAVQAITANVEGWRTAKRPSRKNDGGTHPLPERSA
ncbi:MAG: hypothetical protein ABIS10_11260 [Novosphingobium sp.]